jgi:hypothetical protein
MALSVTGQNDPPYLAATSENTGARTMLRQLSEGVLIVRLNSNDRKIRELERLLNSPEVKEKSRKRFRKMLDRTREETRQESLDIMKAFDGNYNFSKVLFMYDTASLHLKNGENSGYFLNRELQHDAGISLEDERWHMFYFRHESPALFFLLNQQNEQVQRPFPIPKRPVLRRYRQGLYFGRDPLAGNWQNGQLELTSGTSIYMTYSKKKQYKYFSVTIHNWNKDLAKALDRLD